MRNDPRGRESPGLRFGVRVDASLQAPPDVAALAQAAETAGLDSFWLLDNPRPVSGYLGFLGRQQLDSLVACAWAAAATRRIVVGPAAMVAGLRQPELLGGACRTLQALSGGRLIVGVAVGWHRGDFAAFGLPYERRGSLADRAVTELRSGDPAVPVWLAGGPGAGGRDADWNASWLRRARRCDGWLARPQADPDVVRRGTELLELERGRQPFTVAHVNYTALHASTTERVRAMRARIGEPRWEELRDGCWLGDDDDICERVLAMVRAGVRHVIAHPLGCEVEHVERWGRLARRIRTHAGAEKGLRALAPVPAGGGR